VAQGHVWPTFRHDLGVTNFIIGLAEVRRRTTDEVPFDRARRHWPAVLYERCACGGMATSANCVLTVQASNGPVNALVDLTVQKGDQNFGDNMRYTEKIRTTASGTASATVSLRQLFPGKDLNGLWGLSVDIGITTVTVSGCGAPQTLPNTSTSAPTGDLTWLGMTTLAALLTFGVTVARQRRAHAG
jgi:hypothetical protein